MLRLVHRRLLRGTLGEGGGGSEAGDQDCRRNNNHKLLHVGTPRYRRWSPVGSHRQLRSGSAPGAVATSLILLYGFARPPASTFLPETMPRTKFSQLSLTFCAVRH